MLLVLPTHVAPALRTLPSMQEALNKYHAFEELQSWTYTQKLVVELLKKKKSKMLAAETKQKTCRYFIVIYFQFSWMNIFKISCSVPKSCPALCNPMDCSQASLSFSISQSLLKVMFTESVMLCKHLILSPPSPLALSLSQHQGLF